MQIYINEITNYTLTEIFMEDLCYFLLNKIFESLIAYFKPLEFLIYCTYNEISKFNLTFCNLFEISNLTFCNFLNFINVSFSFH